MNHLLVRSLGEKSSTVTRAGGRINHLQGNKLPILILTLLMWRIWWAPNNASKRQMGFNSTIKVLRMKQTY